MKYHTLNKNRDFARIYKKGKGIVHPHVVVYIRKSKGPATRVGITASKKTGNAVRRNRARRVIRHALYEVLPKSVGPYDLVFVARGRTASLKSTQMAQTLRAILEKEGLLQKEKP
ncbi:ribonuclease P protein component [Ruminococcaceae bacterium OttesenSCG-928-I18]|nr:ribonuclease P protein component [Ruminococcaceae bacterium OttesenSCG-928-I18]